MNNCFTAAWHGGNQPVVLLRCYGSPDCFDSGLQLVCILGLVPCLGQTSFWPIQHSDCMIIKPCIGSFSSTGRCHALLENKMCVTIKFVSERCMKCSTISWCLDVDFGLDKTQWTSTSRWQCSPNHHCGNFAVETQNIYFDLKRGLWTIMQKSSTFSLAQVRCFWHCIWFTHLMLQL